MDLEAAEVRPAGPPAQSEVRRVAVVRVPAYDGHLVRHELAPDVRRVDHTERRVERRGVTGTQREAQDVVGAVPG